MILVCTLCCAVLIFAMLAATSAGGIIAICVLYGLFSGACEFLASRFIHATDAYTDVSLISPLFASLANNIAEIGYVPSPSIPNTITNSPS